LVLRSPDLLHQLALGDQLAGVAYAHLDDVPLGRRWPNLAVGRGDAFGRQVDVEVVGLDDRLFVAWGRPAERTQSREQLAHAEGLRDVVVGAGVERGDLVPLGLADGEDDDRDGAPAA